MNESAELNIDVELEELEYRLERLRALYEQYFLGIEKLEPSIPRKDVDRRIWALRKAKIRNTGKKFKLQVLVQRYNTFQQYWGRICREIENGTFKRHMLKAEKILASEPKKAKAPEREEAKANRKGAVLDTEAELAAALASGADLAGDELDDLLGLRTPTGMRSSVRQSAVPGAKAATPAAKTGAPAAGAGKSNAPKSRYELQRLDLDIDDLIGGGAAPIGARPATSAPAARASRPAAPDAPPASAKAPPPVGPMAGVRPRMPKSVAPPAPAPVGPPASAPRHPAPSSPVAAPPPSVRPARPGGGPPPVPARRGPPPVPSRGGPPSQRPAMPPAAGPAPPPARPSPPAAAPTRGAPPAAPPPRRAPTAPPPRAAAGSGGLSDARVRELHARLTDAKRQVNDNKAVSMDGLAKQLRAAEQDLRKRHGNRTIDFDVVIRDGKAIVKPKVK